MSLQLHRTGILVETLFTAMELSRRKADLQETTGAEQDPSSQKAKLTSRCKMPGQETLTLAPTPTAMQVEPVLASPAAVQVAELVSNATKKVTWPESALTNQQVAKDAHVTSATKRVTLQEIALIQPPTLEVVEVVVAPATSATKKVTWQENALNKTAALWTKVLTRGRGPTTTAVAAVQAGEQLETQERAEEPGARQVLQPVDGVTTTEQVTNQVTTTTTEPAFMS